MESSPLYTRMLSGSSSLASFKEDALEQLEFNINDISRASSPASVISTSARSEGHGSAFRDRRHRNSGRTDDEFRRKYSKVKAELELEKIKARQMQQERVDEMRKWKDAFENDRRLEIVAMQKRLEEEKKREMARLKEELIKQKDFELQQVLIYRESEKKPNAPQKERQRRYRIVESKGKQKKVMEQKTEDRTRIDVEENEESAVEKDGDNDVAVVSEKPRVKDDSHHEDRRKRRSTFGRRSLETDPPDEGQSHDTRKSSRDSRTPINQPGHEVDKENSGTRRQGGHVSSSLTEKLDDASVDDTFPGDLATDNTDDKSVIPIKKGENQLKKDTLNNTKDLSPSVGNKSINRKDLKDSPAGNVKIDEKILVVQKSITKEEETENNEKERQYLTKELQNKIVTLESEKCELLKQKEEMHNALEKTQKEHKLHEEEFMTLRAGYDREMRAIIYEHKKVAMGNLEKLKLAEIVLKEATLSDEEIALLSQRPERQRKLSTSSLPGLDCQTKKEDREREKTLQKKLGELATQIQRLERRIALLRTENDALKKKQDDQKPLEEKIRSLKKRNAELAAIARRLEGKAKALQQENVTVRTKIPTTLSLDDSSPEVEHLKRALARQRAKDLSEHAKTMLAKDKELDDLKRKCQDLADELSNGELSNPQNAGQFEEKEELVNIIKQAAKERLQLEQQLAQQSTKETVGDDSRLVESLDHQSASQNYREELEAANAILHTEISKLEQALQKAGNFEQRLTEKTNECLSLSRELQQTKQQKQQLEEQLNSSFSDRQKAVSKVIQLQEQLISLGAITEECNTLKLSLAIAKKDREAAEEEVKLLNTRVHSLENVVRDLQESAEQANHLDNERTTVLLQLQQKQAQLEQLQKTNSSAENRHTQTVSELNKQLLELEEKKKAEEERREELAKEVQRLQKETERQQKIVEEAEQIKRKLREVPDYIQAPKVANENQASLSSSNIKNAEEGDVGEKLLLFQGMDRHLANQNERPVGESFLSSWAQKGPIQVYIAKYNYDPFEFSPNENPEAELPLTAGDYILIVGEMDEDGFFDGELIDGRQGLVPSNFIEKVEDDDLVEFHAALLQAGHGDYSNANNNSNQPTVPTTTTTAPSATSNTNINNNNNHTDFPSADGRKSKGDVQKPSDNLEESFSDLEDIAEIDEDDVSVNSRTLANGAASNILPPCPRSLSLDRQLTNSLLVSWRGPDPTPELEVHSYHVLVDGDLKTSVKSNERMKALIEGVSSNSIHRVCVRCVSNRGQSKDAQCTMLVGKDVYPVPSELKVSHLSPTSASLSWLPGNSNYQHSIILNGNEVRVAKPGVFRHTLTGLAPGALHKVTLIAKSISGALNEDKSRKWMENVAASIEFTTPEAGCLEPPLNVQVEPGPKKGTLLLTWLPVTISPSGVCNGAVVTGYNVMSDGKKVSFVAGPISDHAVLSSQDFKSVIPFQLSVRTVSTSGVESQDSEPVLLSQSVIKELSEAAVSVVPTKRTSSKVARTSNKEEQKGHDTDEEIEEAFREAQGMYKRVSAISEPYSDSSCSELSDIPEVEEDLMGCSQDSRLIEVEKTSPQPAPRKLLPTTADTGPKVFHSQKPTGQGANMLAAPTRVVPAIEIIRDSSTERGTSADEDAEEVSTPSTRSTPTNVSIRNRLPESGISSSYRGDAQNPSAFRQVDQSRHKDGVDVARRAGAVEGEKYEGQVTSSKSQSFNNHPSKAQPHIPTAGHDNQSPGSKHKHSQGPHPDPAKIPTHKKRAAGFTSSPISPVDEAGDTDSISGEINPTVDANTVRLFIALFDYDPSTMSPNVDSIDEELPFREGQILKVFGDKDTDGFYKGENLGRVGFIPCNMVSEVQIDDPEIVEQLLQEATERLGQTSSADLGRHSQISVATHSTATDGQSSGARLTPNGVATMPREGPVMRRMIAMYDYDPQELSPNVDAEMELSFKTGDIVLIYGDMDEDGFYSGEINGQQGLVPSNFLQPAPSSDDDGLESASIVSAERSRSGESLDAALSAMARTEITTNTPKIGDQLPTDTSSSNKQPMNVNFSEIKSEGSRPGTSSPADDEKPKKKGGFLNKSKNIFKKFTR